MSDDRFIESEERGVQLFPYPGSKLKHLKLLYQYAPKLNTYKHLSIPFCGAMPFEFNHPLMKEMIVKEQKIDREIINYSVALNHPHNNPNWKTSKRLIITVNDLDKAIDDIGRVLLNDPLKFKESIRVHLKSQSFFKWILEYDPQNYYERAMQKLYKVFCSFAAKQTNWAYTINNIRDRCITYDEKRYYDVLDRLHHMFIFSEDYETYLRRYISRSKHRLFIYADPPYVVTKEQEYYTHNWEKWNDHLRLFTTLKDADKKGHLFQVSYDSDPKIIKLYEDAGYNVHKVNIRYTIKNQNLRTKKENELIITNYDDYAENEYFEYENKTPTKTKTKGLF